MHGLGAVHTAKDDAVTEPFGSFRAAADAVVAHLQRSGPLRSWMVARDSGEYWTVMQVSDPDHTFEGEEIVGLPRSSIIEPGDIIHWSDNIAPDSHKEAFVPTFGDPTVLHHLKPAAFIGVPIFMSGERIFGTLCGFDNQPVNADLGDLFAQAALLARLLGTIKCTEMRLDEEARIAERLQMEVHREELTGLGNRRAWQDALEKEQSRADRHAHITTLLSIDIDGLKAINDRDGHAAGDRLLVTAAKLMQTSVRPEDTVVRLGGDEFGILCPDCTRARGFLIAQRIRRRLEEAGIQVSVGVASSHPGAGLAATWEQADKMMYEEKRTHKGARTGQEHSLEVKDARS